VTGLLEGEMEKLLRMEERLHQRVVGQDKAIRVVSNAVRRVDQLLSDRGLRIKFTPEALAYLAQVGWDPDFGARPLKRAIQREVQDPLALRMLSGQVHAGQTIRIEKGHNGLEFNQ